MFGEITVLRLN